MKWKFSACHPFALAVLCGLSAGCADEKRDASKTEWAIDHHNDPRHFGVQAKLTYDIIKEIPSIDSGLVPWADTYWPLVNQGLSFRTQDVAAPRRRAWPSRRATAWPKTGLASFLSSHFATAQQNGEVVASLSPAEKHDLLLRRRNGVRYNLQNVNREIEILARLEEEIDRQESTLSKQNAAKKVLQRLESPRNPLQRVLPLSLLGWKSWYRNASNPHYRFGNEGEGENWSWMGHCHGWSAAAIMEEPPRHSVMVQMGSGKPILFTEGDIRGLLTKAWADNPIQGNAHYSGRRCNKNVGDTRASLPVDADGRVFGGEISSSLFGGTVRFHEVDEMYRWNSTLSRMQNIYTLLVPERGNQSVYYIEPQVAEEKALVFTSFASLNAYLSTGDASLGKSAKADFFGCRDVNPAAMHTLLVKYLGQPGVDGRPMRLIMDRTASGQVWNQPLHRADFSLGELRHINDIAADARGRFRAPGTEFLLDVTATIFWTTESDWPYPHYPEGFDERRVRTIRVEYTLEFDADKALIGGEWGHIGTGEYRGWAPDFFWTWDITAKPSDTSTLNYSRIVKPIHKCSLEGGPLKEIEVNGTTLQYSDCRL